LYIGKKKKKITFILNISVLATGTIYTYTIDCKAGGEMKLKDEIELSMENSTALKKTSSEVNLELLGKISS
jgi:hypothetical protein